MNRVTLEPITRRPAVLIAGLVVLTVLAFLGVSRLVHRFQEQEKAWARHLFESGQAALLAGKPELALEELRAALTYNRDNFQYQLALARALRDTGRTEESETYLISLWERLPQDGAVNLALGRLYARENSLDKAIQYYHNAIYGVWGADADTRRRDAQLELIEFLLRQNAVPQAQAELITLAASTPRNSELQLQVARLYVRAQDYEHALAQFQNVLGLDHGNAAALAGAGEAAFQLGRYRTAERYLQNAVRANPQDAQAKQLLETSNLILQADPFARRVPVAERNRRIWRAFDQAGKRLLGCAETKGIDLSPPSPSPGLPSLKAEWTAMKLRLAHLNAPREAETPDAAMELVFQIEQQTEAICGPPNGLDLALLLLSQDRAGAER
ncbi:MAG TPA: tetratricopeptide repeat protein [Terriglobales bacterium]|jgi:tetratricopeptide (TPR) repeat protein|nr:tetratricopeptide repeat protein [Terriglobales bacterium]